VVRVDIGTAFQKTRRPGCSAARDCVNVHKTA
jgi:hypothetical protein